MWQRVQISAIDTAAETVEVQASGANPLEVYYVHSLGEYRMRVYRELGISDTSAATLVNGSLASAHLVDQKNVETAITWPRYVGLIPSQRLALEINSPLPHVFNQRSEQVLHIHAYSQRVNIVDKQALRRAAEIDMRQGV